MDKDCEFDLPHASVVRIIKSAVTANIQLSRECRTALTKCGGIFVLYLTSVANDFCKERKRTTLQPQDVFDALREIDFQDFIPSLQTLLEQRRKLNKAKKERKSSFNSTNPSQNQTPSPETEADVPKSDSISTDAISQDSSSPKTEENELKRNLEESKDDDNSKEEEETKKQKLG